MVAQYLVGPNTVRSTGMEPHRYEDVCGFFPTPRSQLATLNIQFPSVPPPSHSTPLSVNETTRLDCRPHPQLWGLYPRYDCTCNSTVSTPANSVPDIRRQRATRKYRHRTRKEYVLPRGYVKEVPLYWEHS
ncbi:hypothetical protein OPQ81_007676 [Rhizoctonia solani]|nr:hypothetical protein OPQ81_007676 [Rhizoctonia solani]